MGGTRRMGDHRRARALAVLGALAVLFVGMQASAADETGGRIESIELKTDAGSTKVIVLLSRPIAFNVHVLNADPAKKTGRRLLLDFADTTIGPEAAKPIEVKSDLVRQVRTGQFNARTARIVLELGDDVTHSVDAFESPPHVTIALNGPSSAAAPSTTQSAPDAAPAKAEAAAETAPSVGAPEASKSATKTIPVRARGRKPYSLDYSR